MGYMGTFIVIDLHLQIPRELSTRNKSQHCKETAGMCEFELQQRRGLLICYCILCVAALVGFELCSFCRSIQLLQLEVLVSKHQLLLICFNLAKNVQSLWKVFGSTLHN